MDYDVIVIGAGVCGAIAAYKLAEKHKVLIIEAGPDRRMDRLAMAGQFAASSRKGAGSPYKLSSADGTSLGYITGPDNDKDYLIQKTKDEFKSTYQRLVGGSTWHFLGNVPRFIPSDFRLRTLYGRGVDWPLSYDDLEPYYAEAERELGVSGDHDEWNGYLGAYRSQPYPMNKIWQAYGDSLFVNNVDGKQIDSAIIKIMSTPQARNSTIYDGRPACAGNSSCVPICPIQAKYDATVHVNKALKRGATLWDKHVVSRLVADSPTGPITTLEYINYETKQKNFISVVDKIVVLATHAIETPRLLLHSKIATGSKQVGLNLMDHLQGAGQAIAKIPVFPFRGPPTTSGIDVFRDGKHRSDRAAFRMTIGNDGWGRVESPAKTLWDTLHKGVFGDDLRNQLAQRITRMVRIGFSTEMLPNPKNKVEIGDEVDALGLPKPHLHFSFDDYNKDAFMYAYDVVKHLFRLIGCSDGDIKPTPSRDQLAYLGAGHIMGTTRMGTNPDDSVVDPLCCSHDHHNLFIVGPSVFPTAATANPTLTAVALTLRSAEYIQQHLVSVHV